MTTALTKLQRMVDDVQATARERVAKMPAELQIEFFRHLGSEYQAAIRTGDQVRELELAFSVIGYASTVQNVLELEEANAT